MAYTWCTLRCISKRNACIHALEEMHKAMHAASQSLGTIHQ